MQQSRRDSSEKLTPAISYNLFLFTALLSSSAAFHHIRGLNSTWPHRSDRTLHALAAGVTHNSIQRKSFRSEMILSYEFISALSQLLHGSRQRLIDLAHISSLFLSRHRSSYTQPTGDGEKRRTQSPFLDLKMTWIFYLWGLSSIEHLVLVFFLLFLHHIKVFSVLKGIFMFIRQKQTMDVQVTTQVFQWTLPTDEDNDSL